MIALALCGSGAATARAEEPAGPRIAFPEIQLREPIAKSRLRIVAVGPGGEQRLKLYSGDGREPRPFGTLSWSPDGSELAFAGATGKLASPDEEEAIYVIPAAGGVPRRIAGTTNGASPVWSPDGGQIAFSRDRSRFHINPKTFDFSTYSSTTTWIVTAAGGHARRLTPWGNGKSIEPSSFSPDGSSLGLTRENGNRGPEAVLLDLSGGGITVIDREAEGPAFSPDGSRIALASFRDGIVVGKGENRMAVNELYAVDADGGHPQRLTFTPHRQEKAPSWDPSGARIAFIQTTARFIESFSSVIGEVNADGSCPTLVAGKLKARNKPGSLLEGALASGPLLGAPAWQPGSDRGAGPLAC